VLSESAYHGDGVLGGDAQVPTWLVHWHRDFGDGAALPDDAQVGGASLGVHSEANLGNHGADELFTFAHRGGRCVEYRADVGASGGDPGQFLFGQRDRTAGALGGQIVLGGADRGQLGF
jgi:hypothetical protein